MDTERDNMGVHIINPYAVAPASTPLSVSITQPTDPVVIPIAPGAPPPTISAPGDIVSTATASGGTTPYTYSWTLTEIDDIDGVFAVSRQGTTTNATYNDSQIETTFTQPAPPAPLNPLPAPGFYEVECTVTDGASNTATAIAQFSVEAI